MGFLARVFSWVGLAAGIYLAVRFLPDVVSFFDLSALGRPGWRWPCHPPGAAPSSARASGSWSGRLHAVLPSGACGRWTGPSGHSLGVVGVFAVLWLLVPSLAAVPGLVVRTDHRLGHRPLGDQRDPRPGSARPTRSRPCAAWSGRTAPPGLHPVRPERGRRASPRSTDPLGQAVLSTAEASTVKVKGAGLRRFTRRERLDGRARPGRHQRPRGGGRAARPDGGAAARRGHQAGHGRGLQPRRRPGPAVCARSGRDAAASSARGRRARPGPCFGHPNGQDALAVQPAAIATEVTAVGQISTTPTTPSATCSSWPPS